jgi:hypothetical protein
MGLARLAVLISISRTRRLLGSDGKTNIIERGVFDLSAVVPQGMPATDLNEYVSQGLNLLASTLVNGSLKVGFAPT